jgi:hypothetical protein
VNDAQIEFGLFRGCLAYNKINHLLRACPPAVLGEAIKRFDGHFRDILAQILRVSSLSDDIWEHASLPCRFAGLGVTQCKTIAGAAFLGSSALTHELVCALLKRDPAESVPPFVEELLAEHAKATGRAHEFVELCEGGRVQRSLSDEQHQALLSRIKERSSPRMQNLLLACTMEHASAWLHAPPVPGSA